LRTQFLERVILRHSTSPIAANVTQQSFHREALAGVLAIPPRGSEAFPACGCAESAAQS